MIKQSKIRKKTTVDLEAAPRQSRIRRDPPPRPDKLSSLAGRVQWRSREWEIRLALAGILFFAIAISASVIDIGVVLGQ